jgi:hypothetical protein
MSDRGGRWSRSATSSGIRSRVVVALGIGAVVAVLAPASASAAEAVANFEGFTAGTTISTAYRHLGGTDQGIVFGNRWTGPAANLPIVTQLPAGQAQSGTKVGRIGDCGGEFGEVRTWGSFPFQKQFVRVYVGVQGSPTVAVRLKAYDVGGNPLGTDLGTPPAPNNVKTALQVTDPQRRIAFFQVSPIGAPEDGGVGSCTNQASTYIDDVTFDVPAPGEPPPPPDFGLVNLGSAQAGGELGLGQGETSAPLTMKINRINGSKGPLSFSASGLPSGVQVSFQPNSSTNPSSVKLTAKASQTAAAAAGKKFTVTATPLSSGQSPGGVSRSLSIPITVVADYDLRINGIEVTQGIQRLLPGDSSLPARDPQNPSADVKYQGVPLVKGSKTVVRVFVNLAAPSAPAKVNGSLTLWGFRMTGGNTFGDSLPGSPSMLPLANETISPGPARVRGIDRVQTGAGVYSFTLPPGWTTGKIRLAAQFVPSGWITIPPGAECEDAGCKSNNRFGLTDIEFKDTGIVDVRPIELDVSGQPDPPFPYWATEEARTVAPFCDGCLSVPENWQATINVTDLANATTAGDFGLCLIPDSQACSQPLPAKEAGDIRNALMHGRLKKVEALGNDMVIGLVNGFIAGRSSGSVLFQGAVAKSVANTQRPFTSVAHEIHHGFGRVHASGCGGGNSNGEKGESWPPDQRGYIQGLGLDRRKGSGSNLVWSSALLTPGGVVSNPAGEVHDFMSYCADIGNDPLNSWISAKGWTQTLNALVIRKAFSRSPVRAADGHRHSHRTPASTAASGPTMRVDGTVLPSGRVVLLDVGPGAGQQTTGGSSSPYRLVLRDRAGSPLEQVPMATEEAHINRGGAVKDLTAEVPVDPAAAASLGSLEVRAGGRALASANRTANPPTVRVRGLKRGARVGRKRSTKIRWRSGDADGDELQATVEYSADGGRRWRGIWSGADEGKTKVASGLLSASRRARIRVTVSDGFDEASDTSPRFRALGRRPDARIENPTRGAKVTASDTVYLSGFAFDDAGKRLAGKRIRWTVDGRKVGRGPQAAVSGLRPGKRRVRLVARDRLGRKGTASARIRVRKVKPQLIVLESPEAIDAKAKRVKLQLAAPVRARLKLSGKGVRSKKRKRYKLSPKPRRVNLRIKPGSDPLLLRWSTRGGGRARGTIVLLRR